MKNYAKLKPMPISTKLLSANESKKSIHGTAVCVNGSGILITGKPGAGKSRLALALLTRGHQLISDDLTTITRQSHKLIASCPPRIKNLLFVRGLGFIDVTERFGPNAMLDAAELRYMIRL